MGRLRSTRRSAAPSEPASTTWLHECGYYDAEWYLRRYPDVASAAMDAAEHYVQFGQSEDRDPGPGFHASAYVAMNPDAAGRALRHYLDLVQRGDSLAPPPDEVRSDNHPAADSPLFDAAWYRRRYPDRAGVEWPMYADYATWGVIHGASPGPLFDSADYLARHPAIGRVESPLLHYITHRGEVDPPLVVAPADTGPLPVLRPRLGEGGGPSTCVMIHAFYVDVLEELLVACGEMLFDTTLLVTVCSPDDAAAARDVIDRVCGTDLVHQVMVVDNRGRNFAPLLVAAAPMLRRHELVLHLHTKKSLYTGTERVVWRDHLVRALTGPAGATARQLFADDPGVGVVMPSTFGDMPHWASHWLRNTAHGEQLCRRAGIDPRLAHGYVDYPVGGMFWARVDALAPLLDAGLTVDDFEPEPALNDGQLAHAAERMICISAHHRGYRFVEFDYDAAIWRDDWSSRNVECFGLLDRTVIRDVVQQATLVTADLFDTLVLRPLMDPSTLQYYAARATGVDVDEAERMVTARVAAEHRARASSGLGDVTIDEIYAELPGHFSAMAEQERAIEIRVAISRRWLVDLLFERAVGGGRVALMSDTFLDRDTIDAVLEQIGAQNVFEEKYISSERRARKDTEALWELVGHLEQRLPQEWVHIGDNESSDAQNAVERGLPLVHTPAPRTVMTYRDRGAQRWPTRSTDALLGTSAAAVLAGCTRQGQSMDAAHERFGYGVLGPMTLSFLIWANERARQLSLERLLFVARDGWLMHEAVQRIEAVAPGMLVPGEYLAVSRRVALAAAQADAVDIDAILAGGAFDGTAAELLAARLGVQVSPRRRGARSVRWPGGGDEARAALAEFTRAIQAHGREQAERLRRHLAAEGVGGGLRAGLVDLGFAGTTQRCLAEATDLPLHGLYWATTPRSAVLHPDGRAEGYFGHRVEFWTGNWFLDHSLLFERLCAEQAGMVTGYRQGEVLRAPRQPSPSDRMVTETQQAALQYCVDVVTMFGAPILHEQVDSEVLVQRLSAYAPPFLDPPGRIFAGLQIDNDFVGVASADVALL
jgi:FMN phosphatase YigB (HAD superfamily)